MKKIFSILKILPLISHCILTQPPIHLYEAESGYYKNMTCLRESSASGSKFLAIKDSGEVIWNIIVEKTGYYDVIIRYRTKGEDKEQLLIKNKLVIPVGFGAADCWQLFNQSFYFKTGANKLGLKLGRGYVDIDWISLQAVNPALDMTPRSPVFYQQFPCDLFIKIDNYHQEIKNVFLDNLPVGFNITPYPYQESAVYMEVPASNLLDQKKRDYSLKIQLDSSEITGHLTIQSIPPTAGMLIIVPDVNHGSAVLFRLPTGRYMLIDCGQDWVRDRVLIPLFHRNKIDTIHTFIITHYHKDHDSGDRGRIISNQFHVKNFIDYKTYRSGYQWDQDSISLKILNSYEDGDEENTRSLAIKICYNDFIYMHSGDIYTVNQKKIIKRFLHDVPADVFYANHHFHGSLDPHYMYLVNPDIVLIQAQEAIYARDAYMRKYRKESLNVLNKRRETPVETLPALEVGTVVIRVNSNRDWWYETYKKQDSLIIPGLIID
jgi:beta-lactamase superfamily II metal-dependent hydrolase